MDKFVSDLVEKSLNMGLRVILCLVVFILGAKLIGLLVKLIHRSLVKLNAEPGVISFVQSFVKVALYVVLIAFLLSGFGVSTASLAAVLGSAGVTIGLALQGSLSNLAGGVLILLEKPFKVGDYIFEDAHKNEGVVQEIRIFYTRLKTSEGRTVVLPNGDLANTSIMNYTFFHENDEKNVKVSNIKISVAYSSDIDKVKEILTKIVAEEPLRAKSRPYFVRISDYEDSSIVFNIFCEFPLESYNSGRGSIMEKIKHEFDENGITIPFPQMDVHMKQS